MLRLSMVLFSLIGTALAGAGVTAVLAAGFYTVDSIVMAAAIGAGLALPLSFIVGRQLTRA